MQTLPERMSKTVSLAKGSVVVIIITALGKAISYVLKKGFEIIELFLKDKDGMEKGVQWKIFGKDFIEINVHRRTAMVT